MNTSSAPTSRLGANRRKELAVLAILFLLATIWPLVFLGFPAMQDLPNHAARVYVLLHGNELALSDHFIMDWRLVPNLGWDIFGVLVGSVLSLEATVKLFLLLSLSLTIAGMFLLNRALIGRWSIVPLLATPFLFNAGYSKGFLSFNFGVGVALLACAWWAMVPEKQWQRRLLFACAFSLVLFYAHFVVWACYGVFVLACKIVERPEEQADSFFAWSARLLRDSAQVLPPLTVMLVAAVLGLDAPNPGGQISGFAWPWVRLPQIWHVIDGGTAFPANVALLLAASAAALVLWAGKPSFDKRGLLASSILLVFFLAMPDEILNTHWVVWRLALFAVFFAIASVNLCARAKVAIHRLGLGLTLASVLVMSTWQAHSTQNTAVERNEFLDLIDRVPSGSRLFAIHAGLNPSDIEYDRIGLYHFAAYAVFEREIAVQSLFSFPSQQPIRYRDPKLQNEEVNTEVFLGYLSDHMQARDQDVSTYIGNFDWLILHGRGGKESVADVPLDLYLMVSGKGDFRLYCRIQTGPSGKVCPDGSPP